MYKIRGDMRYTSMKDALYQPRTGQWALQDQVRVAAGVSNRSPCEFEGAGTGVHIELGQVLASNDFPILIVRTSRIRLLALDHGRLSPSPSLHPSLAKSLSMMQ